MIKEYQKIINLLDNTPNQPTKFRTKNQVEINDDAHGTNNTNTPIKFKNSMLKSSLCVYSNAYILVLGTVNTGTVANTNNTKNIIIKNCALFTDYISEINNTQIDDVKDFDIIMPMYNLIEYSDNYSKHLQVQRNTIDMKCEIFLNANDGITDFRDDDNSSAVFKFKAKAAS